MVSSGWFPLCMRNFYKIGSITARKYLSNFSGGSFIWFFIHHNTISTKLPVIWFTKKSWGISLLFLLF